MFVPEKRVMLIVPTILTTVPLACEIYLAAFSFIVKLWASAHFFVSRVIATPVLIIIMP